MRKKLGLVSLLVCLTTNSYSNSIELSDVQSKPSKNTSVIFTESSYNGAVDMITYDIVVQTIMSIVESKPAGIIFSTPNYISAFAAYSIRKFLRAYTEVGGDWYTEKAREGLIGAFGGSLKYSPKYAKHIVSKASGNPQWFILFGAINNALYELNRDNFEYYCSRDSLYDKTMCLSIMAGIEGLDGALTAAVGLSSGGLLGDTKAGALVGALIYFLTLEGSPVHDIAKGGADALAKGVNLCYDELQRASEVPSEGCTLNAEEDEDSFYLPSEEDKVEI